MDNALSPVVAERLRGEGHVALYVRDFGLEAAPDEEVFGLANAEDRVLVSADTDFGTLLALRRSSNPSVVIFRNSSERQPEFQARLLLENLPRMEDSLEEGSVVVVEERAACDYACSPGTTSKSKNRPGCGCGPC